ncbi:MAG: fatty acid desaturase [Alphaproteobacteria bacterium]|nr:fatty acid desaturase [Alphaproteobacteria bacterium]MCB9795133.1 fatty acid desaturase [Alphaproteobacteria bacterium]
MAALDAVSEVLDAEDLDRALDAAEPSAADPLPARLKPPPELLGRTALDRLLRDAVLDWAGIVACWVAMSHSPAWLYPLWALLAASRIHGLGVILHEACHMPLRQMRWKARLLELLAGYPLASTIAAMRYHHLRHHRDSCMAQDPYAKPDLRGRPLLHAALWLRTLLILPAWTVRGFLGSLAVFIPALRAPYAKGLLQDRSGRDDLDRSPEVLACARAELPQALAHALLIAAAIAWPAPVLLYFVLPAAVASLLCGWRLLEEHSYVAVHDRRLGSILASTRDHNTDWLGQLLFAPHNIGYHVAHHVHPQVAQENLPALSAWYRAQVGARYPAMRETWTGRTPRSPDAL